ncbi:MAG: hypothetical protein ACI8QF_003446, partial [Limisphaerales bacterium]
GRLLNAFPRSSTRAPSEHFAFGLAHGREFVLRFLGAVVGCLAAKD